MEYNHIKILEEEKTPSQQDHQGVPTHIFIYCFFVWLIFMVSREGGREEDMQ